MKTLELINTYEDIDGVTKLYFTNGSYTPYNLEVETIDTAIFGRVTVQADIEDIEPIQEIYKVFDNAGLYELYMDQGASYAYIDITTYGSPDDINDILNTIDETIKA